MNKLLLVALLAASLAVISAAPAHNIKNNKLIKQAVAAGLIMREDEDASGNEGVDLDDGEEGLPTPPETTVAILLLAEPEGNNIIVNFDVTYVNWEEYEEEIEDEDDE